MDRKWMIVACFFSILTFVCSVVCTSLIFYNEKNRTEINSEKVLASKDIYNSSSIIYNQNNSINISNISPGFTTSRSFSITNNNSNTIKYRIEWNNVVSTWGTSNTEEDPHPEELIYSLSCSNGEKVSNKQMPTNDNDNVILESLEVKTNTTNNCTLTITFKNIGVDQDYNLNKSFGGKYEVIVIK